MLKTGKVAIEKITLKNQEGKLYEGLKCGNGVIPCLIVGPGSFYLAKFSEDLKQQLTLFAFDEGWSVDKDAKIDKEAIGDLDFNGLVSKVEEVVFALKSTLNVKKIGLVGFSAPGLIALGAANKLGEEHIAFVIGSGFASTKLDPEFKAAQTYFDRYAEPERKNRFNRDNENFSFLLSGNSHGKALPNTHFHETEDSVTHEKKRSLTPNSHWTEFVRTLETKQVYDFQNESLVNSLIEEWQFNPLQKVMNEPMRLQFFGKILANLEPKNLIEDLIKTNIPMMLIYGKKDFTTPPPKKKDREEWQKYATVFFKKYEKSVHYPTWEPGSQSQFDKDLLDFLKFHEIDKLFSETHSITLNKNTKYL